MFLFVDAFVYDLCRVVTDTTCMRHQITISRTYTRQMAGRTKRGSQRITSLVSTAAATTEGNNRNNRGQVFRRASFLALTIRLIVE